MTTQAEAFYAGAERRILCFVAIGFLLCGATLWYWGGSRHALGFLIGAAAASVNLLWLKQIAATLAERMSQPGARGSGGSMALRFVLRYTLMAVFAYVMLTNPAVSIHGLLAGLFLPVGAMICEGIYETYVALRRGL